MAANEIKILELVRRIRDEQYERTKNMSMDELLQFYHRESSKADQEARRLTDKRPAATSR
jgi:hypothetical protein